MDLVNVCLVVSDVGSNFVFLEYAVDASFNSIVLSCRTDGHDGFIIPYSA